MICGYMQMEQYPTFHLLYDTSKQFTDDFIVHYNMMFILEVMFSFQRK